MSSCEISLQNAPIPLVRQSSGYISPRAATPRCCFIRISSRVVIIAQLHVAPAAQQQRAHAKDGITTLARKAHAADFEDRGSKRCSRIAAALLEPRSTKKRMLCKLAREVFIPAAATRRNCAVWRRRRRREPRNLPRQRPSQPLPLHRDRKEPQTCPKTQYTTAGFTRRMLFGAGGGPMQMGGEGGAAEERRAKWLGQTIGIP
jgi:hypothetical protein